MKLTNFFSSKVFFAIIFVASFIAIIPILHKGYYPTHDGEWAVIRAADMFREIHDHQFPPRMSGVLYFSYGYPLFNFAYPFPYYLTTFLHLFKFGFINSVKFIFVISVFVSSIFMYLASKKLWKNSISGFVSALFFIYFPYRFVDLYVRGSIGECLSFAFFAIIFWCLAELIDNSRNKIYIFLASIVYAALIMTHNIMAVYFSVILAIFTIGLFLTNKKRAAFSAIFFIVSGILISAFFWLPALTEKKLVLLSKIPIAERARFFVNLRQFFVPTSGYVDRTTNTGFSYNLGPIQLIIFLASVAIIFNVFIKKRKFLKDYVYSKAFFLIISSLFFLFGLFPFSKFIWKLPILEEINFPWTMLAPLGFLVALLAGFLASFRKLSYLIIVLAILNMFIIFPYIKTSNYIYNDDLYYSTNDASTTASFEFTPLWVKKIPTQRPKNHVEILRGDGKIDNMFFVSNKTSFTTNLNSKAIIRVNTFYYPGWQVLVDNTKSKINYNNDYGVMDLSISKGVHKVVVKFSETTWRTISDVVSIMAFIFLLIWFLCSEKLCKVFNNYV